MCWPPTAYSITTACPTVVCLLGGRGSQPLKTHQATSWGRLPYSRLSRSLFIVRPRAQYSGVDYQSVLPETFIAKSFSVSPQDRPDCHMKHDGAAPRELHSHRALGPSPRSLLLDGPSTTTLLESSQVRNQRGEMTFRIISSSDCQEIWVSSTISRMPQPLTPGVYSPPRAPFTS